MTTIEEFDHRHSTDNWAKVSYDKSRWIPMPGVFEGLQWANAAEWAFYQGEMAFLRGGRELNKKVVKKEVLPFSELLLSCYSKIMGKGTAHKYYLHCPDYTVPPVGVYIGLWKCMGTREEAMDYYGFWGTRSGVISDVWSEGFRTEALGDGVRTTFVEQDNGRSLFWAGYAFRNEEYNTDVHVFTGTDDEQRFRGLLPELDVFVGQIYCSPDPHNHGRVIGPDGA